MINDYKLIRKSKDSCDHHTQDDTFSIEIV